MEENMSKLIIKYFSIIATIYLLSMIIDTIYIDDIPSLLTMGLVLFIVNLLFKPLLLLITLPFSILTLGLFSFIVNAWTIMIADYFVPGITMDGFLNSLIAAFIIVVLNHLLRDRNKVSNQH
jgi:putative membrane protein